MQHRFSLFFDTQNPCKACYNSVSILQHAGEAACHVSRPVAMKGASDPNALTLPPAVPRSIATEPPLHIRSY
ncbi:MAG: hypothetical protein II793_00110 [Bacteroidales bacterium]|nr:hypothetical protein [Bacteroidales bacterium]